MNKIAPQVLQEAVEKARARNVDRDPLALMVWAHDLLGDGLMMTTALQKGGMVLLHMIKDRLPHVPIHFLDTGFHFEETLRHFDHIKTEWKINLVLKKPKLIGEPFSAKYGEELHARDPDLCCHLNKTESMAELFGPEGRYQGWITSIRRDQGGARADAKTLEVLEGGLLKVQPLANWARQQVEAYIEAHALPRHPLYDQGYTSIGCAPCTACPSASDSTDERGNRWVGIAKRECGLHTFWKKREEATGTDSQPAGGRAAP